MLFFIIALGAAIIITLLVTLDREKPKEPPATPIESTPEPAVERAQPTGRTDGVAVLYEGLSDALLPRCPNCGCEFAPDTVRCPVCDTLLQDDPAKRSLNTDGKERYHDL